MDKLKGAFSVAIEPLINSIADLKKEVITLKEAIAETVTEREVKREGKSTSGLIR